MANDLTPKWIDKISRLPLDGYNFTSVAAGLRHVVAVVDSNRVLEFKNGKMRDLNIDKSVKVNGCSAGAHHSLIWSGKSAILRRIIFSKMMVKLVFGEIIDSVKVVP